MNIKFQKNTSFQDISENVLNKYYEDEAIILAVVDKKNLVVNSIHSASPDCVVPRLKRSSKKNLIKQGPLGDYKYLYLKVIWRRLKLNNFCRFKSFST